MFPATSQAQLDEFSFVIRRTRRRTLALSVKPDGRITAHAPRWLLNSVIHEFVRRKLPWLRRTVGQFSTQDSARPRLSRSELEDCRKRLSERLPERVAFWAAQMGVRPGRISVGFAKSRWGSCTRRRDLRFTARLALLPEEHLDYVIVHELAHLVHLDHSPQFWGVVAQALPDHRQRRKALRLAARTISL